MKVIGEVIDATFAPLGMIQAFVILALILATMVGLYFFVGRPNTLDSESLRKLAKRRGWSVERKMASGGRGYRIEIRPTDGSNWSCEVTRYRNTGKGGHVRKTEFIDPAANLSDAMVVIGPAIPEKEAEAAAVLFGRFGGGLSQMLLSKLLGGDAESVGDLQPVKDAAIPGATVFATPDTPVDKITAAYTPLLKNWLGTHRDEKAFPILIAGPDRLLIRLRTDTDTADRLEAFLDHVLTSSEALARR